MWKYKTLMIAPAVTLVFVLVTDILKISGWINNRQDDKYVDVIDLVLQLFCIYTIVILYKKLNQKSWQIISLYVLMVLLAMNIPFIFPQTKLTRPSFFLYTVGVLYLISYITFVVSIFNVKRKDVKTLFRLYGFALIFSSLGSVVFDALFHSIYSLALWNQLGRYISDVILNVSIAVLLLIHYKHYLRYEAFYPGNEVLLTNTLENITSGSKGIIIKKHAGSNYYEVEFNDDEGNLLNVLSVSTDDLAHAEQPGMEEPGLEARISAFGQ